MHYMFTDYLQHKTYENLQKLLQKLLQPTSKTTANEQRLRTSSRSYPITPTKGNRHEGTRRIRACVGLKPRRNVRWSRRFRHVTTSLSWDRSKRRPAPDATRERCDHVNDAITLPQTREKWRHRDPGEPPCPQVWVRVPVWPEGVVRVERVTAWEATRADRRTRCQQARPLTL